jgi:outer membrane protein assembly factor BamB
MSGLAVADNRLVTLVQRDGKQWVVMLNAKSGKQEWQSEIGKRYKNSMGHGPRGTPTLVGEHVYAFSGEGILLALKLDDGKIIWRSDTVRQHEGKPADFGMACSPLVVGDHVIVTLGAPGASVVAYDRQTGKLAWKVDNDDPAGYSSPALIDVGGTRQTIVFTGNSALGLAPDSGDVLWRYPFVTEFECNIATPLSHNGQVFLSAGENHGCVLLSLTRQGKTFDVKEVWESFGPGSVMRNEWQTSILLDGKLYGMDNVGGAGPVTHLSCVDITTGERLWRKRRFGKGNLIAADGKLFISTMEGELVVARATPEEYDELGRAKVIDSTRQAPSLANGLLYLRDDREIVCLDVKAGN